MSTSVQGSSDRVALRVVIPRQLDTQLEKQIAGTGLTKREVVESALARELDRMKKTA